MSGFATVTLADGVDAALARIPVTAGVGQIFAEGERNLVIGRPSNLRKWAAGHLGRARPPKPKPDVTPTPGKLPPRPPVDLTPIAAGVAYVITTSAFGQRLAFERLMARHVPLAKRRDLKRPAYLRLDLEGRLPRLATQTSPAGANVFGPFRDTRAAARARDALYRHFRIRPCDFDFGPVADVPLGVADDVACVLLGARPIDDPAIPGWIRDAHGRSLIVDRTKKDLALFPVLGGAVLDELDATTEALAAAIAGIDWMAPAEERDDTPWLNEWRRGRRTGIEVQVFEKDRPADVAARVVGALAVTAPKAGAGGSDRVST